MPTFFRLAGFLLIAGLIVAAVAFFTRTASNTVDPIEANHEATPAELGEGLEQPEIPEENVESQGESLTDEASSETMESPQVNEDQGPELEEGEIFEQDESEHEQSRSEERP